MPPEMLDAVLTLGAGGGGAWFAVRLVLRGLIRDISAAHESARAAHGRIDAILLKFK